MVLTNEDLEKIKNVIQSTMTDKFLNKIANKVSDIIGAKFEPQIASNKGAIDDLRNEVAQLRQQCKMVVRRVEEQEQISRNLNVRIFGLPDSGNENVGKEVVNLFRNKLKLDIKPEDIKKCYRISAKNPGDKPPAIMVRFVNDVVRNAVMSNRKQIKNSNIRIKEDLTKFNQSHLFP